MIDKEAEIVLIDKIGPARIDHNCMPFGKKISTKFSLYYKVVDSQSHLYDRSVNF